MRKKKFVLMSLSVILPAALALGMVSCHAGSCDPTETTGATTAGTTEATVSESAEATTASTTAATEITTAPTEAATVATVVVTEPATEPDLTGGETTPAVDPSEATKETAPDLTVATEPATKPTEAVKPTQPMATEPTTKPTEPKQTEATTAPTTKPTEATKPAHKHSYTAKVTKAATCTAAGTKTFTCACGDSYTESIKATGHSYTSKVTAATCTAQGYTTHTCSSCGYATKDSYTDKTDHDMVQVYRWAIYPDSLYEYECSYGCGESYICNKQGKIAEKLDIAKLEAYGRQYAEDAYGYDGNSKCNPSTNAGYNPGIQWTIYNMEEGYAFVRGRIDSQYERDMYYGYPIWMEIDGEIVRQCVNIDFEPLEDAPNTYIVRVYYGGEADPEP